MNELEKAKFQYQVNKEESSVIAIDFDGVIHSFEDGFGDGTIYGTLVEGAKEAIIELSKKYKIVIYTAKAKKDRPLINGKTGIELVQEWLDKNNLGSYIYEITAEKPRCICYVDDKCIRFENWSQVMKDFKQLYEEKGI